MKATLPLLLAICVVLGASLFWFEWAAAGTTINVTTTSDELTVNGNCSLREAIRAANTDAAVDACPAGSGADTINLPAGVYALSLAGKGENAAMTGDLDLTASVDLIGAGAGVTVIDANAVDRVFQVFAPVSAVLSGMSIRDGSTGSGMGPDYSGGGIWMISGSTVTLSNVHVQENSAGDGGGGVYNNAGTLNLNIVTVSGNHAYTGGGIRNLGSLTATDTTIAGNQTTAAGGGLVSTFNIFLDRVTVSGNTAGTNGGGLYLHSGQASLNNVTISGNTASGTTGGGIWIYYQTELFATNITIVNNSAGQGGALYNTHQQGLAMEAIPSQAEAPQDIGNIHFTNVIVGSNLLSNCARTAQTLPIDSGGHNLDTGNSCEFTQPSDLINTNPVLGTLQDNGGHTNTHALLAGSPAINTGDNTICSGTDQRGVSRPQGGTCDIGAYERIPTGEANLSLTKVDALDPVIVGSNIVYDLTVNNLGPDSAVSISLTDNLPGGVSFVSATASQGNCGHAAGVVTCDLDTIASGCSAMVQIIVTADTTGEKVNIASVTSSVSDPNLANNSASASTSVDLGLYLPYVCKY